MRAGWWLAVGYLVVMATTTAMAWAMSERRFTMVVVFGVLSTVMVVCLMVAENCQLKKRIKEGRE